MRLTIDADLETEAEDVYTHAYIASRVQYSLSEALDGWEVAFRGTDTARIIITGVEIGS